MASTWNSAETPLVAATLEGEATMNGGRWVGTAPRFAWAILRDTLVPASQKEPPTNRCPIPSAASELTVPPGRPEPRPDQALQFHVAIPSAGPPAAFGNHPP